MAKSVNKVILLGNVGHTPTIKKVSGSLIAELSLATTERYREHSGNFVDQTEWHNLVAFGRTAEVIRDYVDHGSKLYVEGKLKTRSWDDKDTGKKRYRTQVVILDLSMVSPRKDGSPRCTDPAKATNRTEYEQAMGDDPDGPPF